MKTFACSLTCAGSCGPFRHHGKGVTSTCELRNWTYQGRANLTAASPENHGGIYPAAIRTL
jgi:hypothetical protein